MKKIIGKSFALCLSAVVLAGFAGCTKPVEDTTGNTTLPTVLEESNDTTAAVSDTETEDTEADDTVATTSDTQADGSGAQGNTKSNGAFKQAELIKLGNHTYYTSDLFATGRDKDYKDIMIKQLEEADKELNDDVYVFGTGESEVKEQFRFFGLMMQDGVVFDSANMTCWYDEAKGHFWAIDSTFRRANFNKSGLINAEDAFDKVYEKASTSEKALRAGKGEIKGTYMLSVNKDGTLYYNFTINKYSTVGVDAKTGEIISSRFWDGIYT